MLVRKQRHRASALPENLNDLLEQLITRIELLAHLVGRIIAVFPDQQHGIDAQLITLKRESVRDGWVNLEIVFGRKISTHVVFSDLVGIHRDDSSTQLDPNIVGCVSLEDAAAYDVGMRAIAVLGYNGGDGFLFHR